jgi:hypothetical protein
LEEVTVKNLRLEGRKIGIQGPTYSAPWMEHIRNSEIKATTGVSLRNSPSNERHSKVSFASHFDFKQKGLGQATYFDMIYIFNCNWFDTQCQ